MASRQLAFASDDFIELIGMFQARVSSLSKEAFAAANW